MVASTIAALDSHLANKSTILITAQPGTGTVTTLEAKCEEHGLTMERHTVPFLTVDELFIRLVGLPIMAEDGKVTHLLEDGKLGPDADVIVFDEFDRAAPDLQHAIEELVKFSRVGCTYLPTRRTVVALASDPEFAATQSGTFGVIV